MENIVGEYVEEITLPDDELEVMETFTSLTNEITYTGYKVLFDASMYKEVIIKKS